MMMMVLPPLPVEEAGFDHAYFLMFVVWYYDEYVILSLNLVSVDSFIHSNNIHYMSIIRKNVFGKSSSGHIPKCALNNSVFL